MTRLPILALALTGVNASILGKRQDFGGSADDFERHVRDVCEPLEESGQRDFNAPCNAFAAIQQECQFGHGTRDLLLSPDFLERYQAGDEEAATELDQIAELDIELLSPDAQRACICQSQFNNMVNGCMRCYEAHGGKEDVHWVNESMIEEAVGSYCDADVPATEGFINVLVGFLDPFYEGIPTELETATYSDPIGNATAVSNYFTPSVTGTPAYAPAFPTGNSSGENITFTSTSVSGGMIVPTASGAEGAESSDAANSDVAEEDTATATFDGGAVQSAMAHSGAVGVLGFAALIAAL